MSPALSAPTRPHPDLKTGVDPPPAKNHRASAPRGEWVGRVQACDQPSGLLIVHLLPPRDSSLHCVSPTQRGPRAFRWTNLTSPRCPARPRGRQFSLQFSRQSSKGSIRSLPSPSALGQRHRRRGLTRFRFRPAAGPPEPEHRQDFQGMGEVEDQQGSNEEAESPTSDHRT